MSWLTTLGRRDRQILAATGCAAVLLIIVLVLLGPAEQDTGIPASDSKAPHGAYAAYLLLEKLGYRITRSTDSLAQVAGSATPQTTLILADPFYQRDDDAAHAVQQFLARGGRVLVTGFSGALLLPHGEVKVKFNAAHPGCAAQPVGLSSIASSGDVHIDQRAYWAGNSPQQEVAYRCGKDAVVVTWPSGKGTVVWWSSASPLENANVADAGNMALLLNSIGPRATTQVLWDESLHGALPSIWSYASGTVLPLVWWQCVLLATLLLFSFSRRSGPLRPDPVVRRAAPLEFIRSLGSLYRKAAATNIAVSVACQAFRLRLQRDAGISVQASPGAAVAAILRRYPKTDPGLENVLAFADQAATGSPLSEKSALRLILLLQAAERELT